MSPTSESQLQDGLRHLALLHDLPELEDVTSVAIDGGVLISAATPCESTGRAWARVLGLDEASAPTSERRAWSATWTDERSGWLTTWQVETA